MDNIDEWIYKIKNWWNNTAIMQWWNNDVQAAGGFGPWIGNKLKEMWDATKQFFSDLVDGVVAIVTWIKDQVLEICNSLTSFISEIYDKVKDKIVDFWNNTVSPFLQPVIGFMKKYIAAPIKGLNTFLTAKFVTLADKLWVPSISMDWSKWDPGLTNPFNGISDVFSFQKYYPLKNLVTEDMRSTAKSVEGKGLGDIISDEISKVDNELAPKPLEVPSVVNAEEIKKQAEEAVSQQAEPLATIKAAQEQANQEAHEANEQMTEEQKKKDEQQQ